MATTTSDETESETPDVNPALKEALAKVEAGTLADAAWDELEDLADAHNAPDEVAAAYRATLEKGLGSDDAQRIADRAVKFTQEWFIDTPEAMPELLTLVVDKYPALEWAFERLVVVLTQGAKWDELLSLYDRTLSATRDEKKRKQLLDDAARLAKDFADQPDRAADYLLQLLALEPGNEKLITSLERLLERQKRHQDLLTLWRTQLDSLSTDEARMKRVRIAEISIEKLDAPQQAMAELRALIDENPNHAEATALLERILANEEAPQESRRESLDLLRTIYEVTARPEDVVRVVLQALAFVEGEDERNLRREVGNRLTILERHDEAMEQYAALLKDSPNDADARRRLRQLAKRSGHFDRLVDALTAAAENAENAEEAVRLNLWLSAAQVRRRSLDDAEGAITLFQKVLDADAVDEADARIAAHQLNELLAEGDRGRERLVVLERLADLERSPSLRRQILGEAARLAADLDDDDRAIKSWQDVLRVEEHDLEALAALASLFEKHERWEDLVGILRQRQEAPVSDVQRQADMTRIARLQQEELEKDEEALTTWLAVRERFGDNRDLLAALTELLAKAARHEDLAALLAGSVGRERGDITRNLVRLADLYRTELARPRDAAQLYRQALELDPKDEAARAGAHAMLPEEDGGEVAGEALWGAYERTDEIEPRLDLVGPRLEHVPDPLERATLLAQAATLHQQIADLEGAMGALRRAIPLDPTQRAWHARLERLAQQLDKWEQAAAAFQEAATAVDAPAFAAELRRREARIHREERGEHRAAAEAYTAAADLVPGDASARVSAARAWAQAASWDDASIALVAASITLGRTDRSLVGALREAAAETTDRASLAKAIAAATEMRIDDLDPRLASSLFGIAADLHPEDGDPEAAVLAAERALQLNPGDPEAQARLVDLQRRAPGPGLVESLLTLDVKGDDRQLDALREAAEIALTSDDEAIAGRALDRLFGKAARLWRNDTSVTGTHTPEPCVRWALTKLEERRVGAGNRVAAAELLLRAGELPFPGEERSTLHRRAAEHLAAAEQPLRAMDAYRRALADAPDDLELVRALAALAEREEAQSGAAALRRRELELTEDVSTRLELRLNEVRRTGSLETSELGVALLVDNLEEQPGHEPSVQALATLLQERREPQRLVKVLEEQANTLRGDDPERAATLWGRIADVAEQQMDAPERAIAAHREVVELAEDATRSLDALARLHSARDEHGEAAKWLRMRLDSAAPKQKVAVRLKLARAQLAANLESEAITTLSSAFDEAPQSAEVRKQLIPLLRTRQDWRTLASVLTRSVEHTNRDEAVLAYAREGAAILHERLGRPADAVDVLRRAVELAPDDRRLKAMLAESLRTAGELDEAQELLEALIKAFGRRGSRDRAQAHMQLARVLHARGDHDAALTQLDTASKMDADNVEILEALASIAREADQLQRAEAALRTLLLTARRLQGTEEGTTIGTSEVLFELSSLATARGQEDQAEELAESAIEALAEGDAHAPRLQKKLREQGEHALLIRLLAARLEYVRSPYRRGHILAERSQALQELGKTQDAFDTRLEAITVDPGSPLLHEGTRELAVDLDAVDAYRSKLEDLLRLAKRDTDAMIRVELLLRLGESAMKDAEDHAKAADYFQQAEETGVREVDVLRAKARLAGARGDEEEQMGILERLASLGEDQAETRASALYRIAEVQLAAEDSLEHGIESLRKAIADHPNPERACTILRRACEQHADREDLLELYEQVARDSGDDKVLLDYLERRASHGSATPDLVKEAVQRAEALGQSDRAEGLMKRAVELARQTGSLGGVDWALLGLSERALEAGNVQAAVDWLDEASTVAPADPLFALGQRIADAAAATGADAELAAKLYERLRERDPMARAAWEPLVKLYDELGNVEDLERVVKETLDGLQEMDDRNALRLLLARALLKDDDRVDDAIEVLREALFDAPGHPEALGLLSESLERSGRTEELVELLRDQLFGAKDRGDDAAVKQTALRLAGLLEGADATDVLRDALADGNDPELVQALLDRLGEDDAAERATLLQKLLETAEGDAAAKLAKEAAALYEASFDADGVLRALELGLERAPADLEIRKRLEDHYREQGDGEGLAKILESTAQAAEDDEKKAALLLEAALTRRDQLDDASRAVELLAQARTLRPSDPKLTIEHAKTIEATGDREAAIAAVGEGLELCDDDAARLELLRVRADMRTAAADDDGALQDLEVAFGIDPQSVRERLREALDQRRVRAVEDGDVETERAIALRVSGMMLDEGRRDDARMLLLDFTDRHPSDVEVLGKIVHLAKEDEAWVDVERISLQLVELTEGDPQIAAAADLLAACEQLGQPENARATLESVWGAQRSNAKIRGEVRHLYELLGEHGELAKLLIEEAGDIEDVEEKVAHLRWAGEALLSTGDIATARGALEQVLALKPDDAEAICLVADAHIMASDFEAAHTLLDEAISSSRRTDPHYFMFYQRKAYVHQAEGDPYAQLDALKRAYQSARKNPYVAAELADLAEALEEFDLAVTTLRSITTMDEQGPISPASALVRQGRIALRQGDEKRARLCARRAAMTDAEAEDVQELLAELGES